TPNRFLCAKVTQLFRVPKISKEAVGAGRVFWLRSSEATATIVELSDYCDPTACISPVGVASASSRGLITMRRPRTRLEVELLEKRCLLSSDPILDWNVIAIEVNRRSYSGMVVNDEFGPTRSSRALAIEHVAMFDAWNSIHHQFTPYLVMAPNANGASDEAAVAQAAHDTLLAMYPSQQAFIDTALANSLALVPANPTKTRGTKVG